MGPVMIQKTNTWRR